MEASVFVHSKKKKPIFGHVTLNGSSSFVWLCPFIMGFCLYVLQMRAASASIIENFVV